jgi:hypothetical protein
MGLFGRFSHFLSCQMLIKLEEKKIIFVIAKIGPIGEKHAYHILLMKRLILFSLGVAVQVTSFD